MTWPSLGTGFALAAVIAFAAFRLQLLTARGAAGALPAVDGALAAVNADTWATEVGVLARRCPWRLTDGRQVEPGTSGAVTLEGLMASIAGAAVIGLNAGPASG